MLGQADAEQDRAYLRAPLLGAGVAFASGIAIAPQAAGSVRGNAVLLAFAAVVLVLGLTALAAGWLRISGVVCLLGFVAAGSLTARLFEARFPSNHISRVTEFAAGSGRLVRLEGQIIRTPLRTPYGLQFDLEARTLESRGRRYAANGKVRLRLPVSDDPEISALTESLHLQQGASIRALVQLHRPRTYQNPGSFDFRRWMESIEDLYWIGTIKNPLLIERLQHASGARVSVLIERIRQRLLRSIDDLYPPWSAEGRDGSVLKAVLLGDRSALDSDTIENFRKTGLYHLLVIAGLHVGLLAMLAGVLLKLLRLRESARTVLVMIFLLGYALLVEQRAPTLRATLMISMVLVARLLYRDYAGLNSIGLAGLALLVHRPAWLFESGFQLSFSAALLIAGLAVPILDQTTEPYRRALWQLNDVERDSALAPRLAQFRLDLRSLIRWLTARFNFFAAHQRAAQAIVTGPMRLAVWIAGILLFSLVLQVGLLLPMARIFHRVTFAGIGLNAVAIPVMTLLLAFAVPTVALSAVWPALAVWPGKALGLLMVGLFSLTDVPHLPVWLSYRVPDPPRWVAWGFAASLIVTSWALARRKRFVGAAMFAAVILAALISLHPFAPRIPSGVLEITALDCGRDTALFVVLPDRTTLLLRAGSGSGRAAPQGHGGREGPFQRARWNPGENIVSPYLWSRGIERIDILVLTSARENQLAKFESELSNFHIAELWHGQPTLGDEAFITGVGQDGVHIRRVNAAERINRGATSIQILWPPAPQADSPVATEQKSVAMRITHGAMSILLSDIGAKVEKQLANSGLPLESQVLKVGRQGGRSINPEFLARVSPRFAIMIADSAGSSRGPQLHTIERLRAVGARILRTDLDGAVTVEIKGAAIGVRSYGTSRAE